MKMAVPSYQAGYMGSPHMSHDASHMHPGMVTSGPAAATVSTLPQTITTHEAIEVAGRNVEKMIHSDSQFPSLAEKLRLGKILTSF